MTVDFPWFFERSAPQSKLMGMNYADLTMSVSYDVHDGFTINGGLSVLVTTLCPCSKDISEYSAHNQRGRITIDAYFYDNELNEEEFDWKAELLHAAESNASAPLHPVLKRPDEKVEIGRAHV